MKSCAVFIFIVCCFVASAYSQAVDETPKSGHCPLIIPELVGTCSRDCEFDSQCNSVDKCCRNACGGTHCHPPQAEDPCINHKCEHEDAQCVNEGTHSICKCPEFCIESYDPVCGQTDGSDEIQEYSNKCMLSVKACKLNKKITEVLCSLKEKAGAGVKDIDDTIDDIKDDIEDKIDDLKDGAEHVQGGFLAIVFSSIMAMMLLR
ncbi:WAP, Kazal, immunoglobulin, Kunitz and NTR domain-containing protein-like [Ptychodera flava]|uniref:WAP, Kazal, immunoglobulin, Kunitz and NTR domain-containing protein-like n=1 Tax=Ptychodera flava TaxID=63121 RepID=UPI00396A0EB9